MTTTAALAKQLASLYQQCERKKPAFDALIIRLAEQTSSEALLVPLKNQERAFEKLVGNLGGRLTGLTDILRATLIFETQDAVIAGFDFLLTQVSVLRKRNLYSDALSLSDGYRDVKIDFDFDGIAVELQLNTRRMLEAKAQAHIFYEEKRKLLAEKRSGQQLTGEQRGRLRELDRLMRGIYQETGHV